MLFFERFKNLQWRGPIESDLEEVPYSHNADEFDKDVGRESNDGMATEDNADVTIATKHRP